MRFVFLSATTEHGKGSVSGFSPFIPARALNFPDGFPELCRIGSRPSVICSDSSKTENLPKGAKLMQFALLVIESPEAFASRKSDGSDPYTGAWRAYHKALVESGTYLAGDPLEVPETATTIRIKEGKRRVQDGPFADAKEQLGGFIILELPSIDAALDWAARCPAAAAGAVEVRPLAPAAKRRITG
jgi:hypothetical protein